MVRQTKAAGSMIESTAYHEAGHAIAANALGLGVQSVSIVRKDFKLGVCHYMRTPRTVRETLICALSGPIAEALLNPDNPDGEKAGWSGDLRNVRAVAEDLLQRGISREAVNQTIRDCAGECERILRGNWSAVTELAGKLMESGELVARV